jgi:hypothetical protein
MAISEAQQRIPISGRIGLFASRKADLSVPFSLSDMSRTVLSSRGLDDSKQAALSDIYSAGRSSIQSGTSLDFIKSLDSQSLTILQGSTWRGKDLDLGSLSEEQAENLLLQPGEGIDSNNDGIVETVDGNQRMFPPLNAPQAVKDAWTSVAQFDPEDSTGGQAMTDLTSNWLDGTKTTDKAGRSFGDPTFDWSGFVQSQLDQRQQDSSAAGKAIHGLLQRFAEALKSAGLAG